MKFHRQWLLLICATLMTAACIPRGGQQDYRIVTPVAAPVTAPATLVTPRIVSENDGITANPSWSPKNVTRNARQVTETRYIVKPGDTLYQIEAVSGAGLRQIVDSNDLVYPYILKVGQELTIPAGRYHRVSRGETGIAIARAYGVSWSEIVTLNSLVEPYILREGQRLRLPDATNTASQTLLTPEQRAASFAINIDDVVTGGEPAVPAATSAPLLSSQIVKPASFGGRFAWPLRGTIINRFGSMGGGRVNDGIKISAAKGTPVNAAADGVVVYSGNEIGVFGGLILVDHGAGWVSAYGHLGALQVARGDRVKSGEPIGNVGETGYVDQPQLHFEIRRDRKPVDPAKLLPTQ